MKKVINGTVYDDSEASSLCYVSETKKIGIDGVTGSVELRKTLMRMRKPKAGVLPHETFRKSSFDPKWLVVDTDKFEDTGAFFFTLAIGPYGNDVFAIVPASRDEACYFMEEHAGYDDYIKQFGRPDGFDLEAAKKAAQAINEANDARDAAKKDLETKTEELATTITKLADANSIVDQRDMDLRQNAAVVSSLGKTLESRNNEIAALNEEISRLNAELENLRVVKESPVPAVLEQPNGEEDL